MNDKPPYIFSRENWISIAIFSILPVTIMNLLKQYSGIMIAGFIGIMVGVVGFVLIRRKIATTAIFQEEKLILHKGILYKKRVIYYSQIDKLRYVVDRFQYSYVFLGKEKIKLPPIPFKKSDGFLSWLKSKNPIIEIDIVKP